MWDKLQFIALNADDSKTVSPEWVIDRLHAYADYFQKVTMLGAIIRQVGIFFLMILYSIDSLFSKLIFSILGMSLASDTSKTGSDFNTSLLGLLGNAAFQKIVQVGMGIGIMTLGGLGLWLYIKILLGKRVAFGEVFSNLFTTAIIALATPMLIAVSIRGGAYFFSSLAMRNFSTDPTSKQVTIAKTTSSLSEDFVWSFVKTDITGTGDAVTGQYKLNGGIRLINSNWSISNIQAGAENAADYNEVIKNNFLIDGTEPRKQDIGSQANSTEIANFTSAFAGQKSVITPTVTSWYSELNRTIPAPSDVAKASDNWWQSFTANVDATFNNTDKDSDWGIMAVSTYDIDTYNVQTPSAQQKPGSGSKLIPIKNTDMIPFSKGRYYYYSVNWSVIITLLVVGLLLLDVFYKLTIALLDILATLFIGWAGMTATAESGRGNAVFIESMMNYGKIALVSGASLGLYIVTSNYIKGMITALKTNGTLSGVEALIAGPIVLAVITFAFLNGSNAFIKFTGADAGFGIAGGLFGAITGRTMGGVLGKTKQAAGAAMKKGVDVLSSNKSEKANEKAAERDVKRNYNKASQIIDQAENGNITTEERDKKLEALGNTNAGSNFLKRRFGVNPSAQSRAQQRMAMLKQKAERNIATDDELNELSMMDSARTGYAGPNFMQRRMGVSSKDLSASPANQVDNDGNRKGALDLNKLKASRLREQYHHEQIRPQMSINDDQPQPEQPNNGSSGAEPHQDSNEKANRGSGVHVDEMLRSNQGTSENINAGGTRQTHVNIHDQDTVVKTTVEDGITSYDSIKDERTPVHPPHFNVSAPEIKSEQILGTQTVNRTTKGPDTTVNQNVKGGKVNFKQVQQNSQFDSGISIPSRKGSNEIPKPKDIPFDIEGE